MPAPRLAVVPSPVSRWAAARSSVAQFALAAALAAATLVCIVALMLFVVLGPLVAGAVMWAEWARSEDAAAWRLRRLRARIRRRARALGLHVLALPDATGRTAPGGRP